MFWKLKIPRVSLLGKYNVNGKVLVLPIKGNGDMNVTLGGFRKFAL
jgi:Haemolymph juvenile hormone binding protein (JHBP)